MQAVRVKHSKSYQVFYGAVRSCCLTIFLWLLAHAGKINRVMNLQRMTSPLSEVKPVVEAVVAVA